MSNNSQNVKVSVSESKIGRAAGDAVAKELDGRLRRIENNTDSIQEVSSEVRTLQRKVEQLEEQMATIERTKARAEREATESIRDKLESQYEEKRRKFEEKKRSILEDYQSSIKRLKDRFINSIPGQSEGFDQVNEEFETATERRDAVVEEARRLGTHGAGAVHEYRRRRLSESRSAFTDAIDDFLADRRETADTIDSLQTQIPGINGDVQVNVPFWVVGIERNGQEEIHALPIQTWTDSNQSTTERSPYAARHRPHGTHDFSEWTDAVERYASRDEVRDALADRDAVFEDPSYLRNQPGVRTRFVDALENYEFGGRQTAGSGRGGASQSARAGGERSAETAEVVTDD
ncbi:hypothetical protein [Halosimplex marinum]|uniref:hypothetical protein n=1 Tax=Halosimplex marinum TaxID=3396620 RepID=UPI003F562B1F